MCLMIALEDFLIIYRSGPEADHGGPAELKNHTGSLKLEEMENLGQNTRE